ncbi:MAG TPA: chorismate mutase [Caulobacteraceae bacterium]|nr:chorismate mutase [Caulobacteraceae bacterium]
MDELSPLSLEVVRRRIDEIDAAVLRLIDERAGLAHSVAEAKKAAGEGQGFALRPAREAEVLRNLLRQRTTASPQLVVYLWRQIMADSLARQGPYHLSIWGGPRLAELARLRFGASPPLRLAAEPAEVLAAAKTQGGVGVLALTPDNAWWGRLLAEPGLSVFAALPDLARPAPAALAVAAVEVEPSGGDETLWVTDSALPAAKIVEALARDGLAADLLVQAGGLKLFTLAGFVQRGDARLERAPGELKGVIGAASTPFDV